MAELPDKYEQTDDYTPPTGENSRAKKSFSQASGRRKPAGWMNLATNGAPSLSYKLCRVVERDGVFAIKCRANEACYPGGGVNVRARLKLFGGTESVAVAVGKQLTEGLDFIELREVQCDLRMDVVKRNNGKQCLSREASSFIAIGLVQPAGLRRPLARAVISSRVCSAAFRRFCHRAA